MMKSIFTATIATTLFLSACQESPNQLLVQTPQAQQAALQSDLQNKSFRWQVLIQPPKAQGRTPLKPDLLTSFRIGTLQIPIEQIQRLDLPASRAGAAPPESVISPDAPIQVQYKGNGQYVIQFKQAPPKPWIVQMQIQGYDQPASFPWVESQGDQLFTVQISRNTVGQTQVKGFYPQLTQAVRSFTVEPQPDNQQDLVWQQADGSSKRMDFDQILQASQTSSSSETSNDPVNAPASDAQFDSSWPSSFDDNWSQPNDTSMTAGSDSSVSEDPWAEVDQMFGQLEGSSTTSASGSANPGWEDSGFQSFPAGTSNDSSSIDTSNDSTSSSAEGSSSDSSDSSSGGES